MATRKKKLTAVISQKSILIIMLVIGALGYLFTLPVVSEKVGPLVNMETGVLMDLGGKVYNVAQIGVLAYLGVLLIASPVISGLFFVWAVAVLVTLINKFR